MFLVLSMVWLDDSAYLSTGLFKLCCNFDFECSRNDLLLGLTVLLTLSLERKERNILIDASRVIVKEFEFAGTN